MLIVSSIGLAVAPYCRRDHAEARVAAASMSQISRPLGMVKHECDTDPGGEQAMCLPVAFHGARGPPRVRVVPERP